MVTAAALIMSSVFVAFIPSGSATIQPIALGLAVGVFVDAFIVRMTLVPAVLVLLGRKAWWLPRGWPVACPRSTSRVPRCTGRSSSRPGRPTTGGGADGPDLVVHEGGTPVQVSARPAEVTRVGVPP